MKLIMDFDNLLRIEITKIDNNGVFRGYEPLVKNVSEEKQCLCRCESQLKYIFNETAARTLNRYYQPREGSFVAVKISPLKDWHRGYVTDCLQTTSGIQCNVFLIDYGIEITVIPQYLRPLPASFSAEVLSSQTLKLVLYGVVPTYFDIDFVSESKFRRHHRWLPKHGLFINKIIKKADKIFFKEICQVEEFKFGYVYVVWENGESASLQQLMIDQQLAVLCEEFESEIPSFLKRFRESFWTIDKPSVRKLLYPHVQFDEIEQSELDEVGSTTKTADDSTGNSSSDAVSETMSVISNTTSLITDSEEEIYSTPMSVISDDGYVECNSSNVKELERYKKCNRQINSKTPSVASIESAATSFDSVVDKILVLGNERKNHFKPAHSLKDIKLDVKTLEMLTALNVRDIIRCQKYLIPAMLANENLVAVDGPETGKTIGYLIALISLLRKTKSQAAIGVGPRSIILCPYSATCEWIQKQCISLIQGKVRNSDNDDDDVRVNVAYGTGTEMEQLKLEELAKGYDILICTPRCLLRLLKKQITFDLRRLAHIVFDEIHVLLKSYWEETALIMEVLKKKNRVQRIIISNYWMLELKHFVKEDIANGQGSLLISCYLEAGLFVSLRSRWQFKANKHEKIDNIIKLLEDEAAEKNVVIVYNTDENMMEFHFALQKNCSRRYYMVHEISYLISETANQWKADVQDNLYPILLCNDYTLPEMHVYEADYLIHYSLPNSKNEFLNRFSVLLHRTQCVGQYNFLNKSDNNIPPKPATVIYSDPENLRQFPAITEIMTKLRARIPVEIKNLVNEIKRSKEFGKKGNDLCRNWKEFGKCMVEPRCNMRHVFLEEDQPDPSLPKNGFVKVQIKHVFSPTHFAARILQHRTKNSIWTQLELPNPGSVTMKLVNYFNNKNNRKGHPRPKIGDVAAVEESFNCFKRVKIIEIKYASRMYGEREVFEPKTVVVKYIDDGPLQEISVSRLYELPTMLAAIPECVVDIFVCNLLPSDEDSSWGDTITEIVKQKIFELQRISDNYFCGKINVVIGRALWLHPFECQRWLSTMKETIVQFSMRKFLIEEKLAVRHEHHLSLLAEKCKEAKLNFFEELVKQADEKDIYTAEDTEAVGKCDNARENLKNTEIVIRDNKTHSDEVTKDNGCANPREKAAKTKSKIVVNGIQNEKRSIKPIVEWRQDFSFVYVTVNVNSENYNASAISKNAISFRAEVNEKVYEFNEQLFAAIDVNNFDFYKSGVTIRIKMKKLVKGNNWLRLLKSRDPQKWVKLDYNFIDMDENLLPPWNRDIPLGKPRICDSYYPESVNSDSEYESDESGAFED